MQEPVPVVIEEAPSISSRAAFHAGVAWAVAAASATEARQMRWVDQDFADWPLDDSALLQSLGDWLRRPQRRLEMLAHDYEKMATRHPRFTEWRRTWSHVVDTRAMTEDHGLVLPAWIVVDRQAYVELLDRSRWRGRAGVDPHHTSLLALEIDALAQRSVPDFPATRLGL